MTVKSYLSFVDEALEAIRAKNLYRQCRVLENPAGIYARYQGKDYVLFCGNDYLGLSQHPKVVAAFEKAARKYGVGSGAARLISGTGLPHQKLEEKIASFKQKPKALLFSSGYLANFGALSSLAGEKDVIILDKLSHASLIDAARLSKATVRVFPHKDYDRLEEILRVSKEFPKKLIVSDTVFSMDGDVADIQKLIVLKKKHGAILVLDDAHGTGVLGKTGRGALEGIKQAGEVDVSMGTLSKAIGGLGGFLACSEKLYEFFTNFSRTFIYDTALPPAICEAALASFRVIESKPAIRRRLFKNMEIFAHEMKPAGMDFTNHPTPIYPVIVGEEKKALDLSLALAEEGFLVPAVRPPTVPKGKARIRVTLSALHSPAEIKRLTAVLKKLL